MGHRKGYGDLSADDAVAAARNAADVIRIATYVEEGAVKVCVGYGLSPRQIEQSTGISKSRADRIGRNDPTARPEFCVDRQPITNEAADLIGRTPR